MNSEASTFLFIEDQLLSEISLQDEKLQNLLGHFQKDYEGGAYAENLGKKKQSCHPLCSVELLFFGLLYLRNLCTT
jgi:hypothetical protein